MVLLKHWCSLLVSSPTVSIPIHLSLLHLADLFLVSLVFLSCLCSVLRENIRSGDLCSAQV